MCGIIGYVGKNNNATQVVLDGLRHLVHRGYDSIGLCRRLESGEIEIYKVAGTENFVPGVNDLRERITAIETPCRVALGHNRWATFGGVNTDNAHPHVDQNAIIHLVQNGNVENLDEVEKEIGTWPRYSGTDTEAIANLVAKYHQKGDSLEEAVKKTINFLAGANVVAVISKAEPNKMVVANKGGTIILGQNEDGVVLISDKEALDAYSFAKIYKLKNNEVAVISAEGWRVSNLNGYESNNEVLEYDDSVGDFSHYMMKEIHEQAKAIRNTLSGRIDFDNGTTRTDCTDELGGKLRRVKTFHFVGCGTAYNACLYACLLLSRFGINARAWIASEFCYSHPVFEVDDAFVYVSQSGETADTIEVVREIDIKGNLKLGIVNVAGSKIWSDVHAGIGIRAGKERGVASTKAYTCMLVSIVILAVFLARQRNMTIDTGLKIIEELERLPEKIEMILSQKESIKEMAAGYRDYDNYYFLGRYFNSVTAAEGSLKLKEISYVHAESYPLGEMKHGPLALIDKDFCSVVIAPRDRVYDKSLVNIQEIKARKGTILAIANESAPISQADDQIFVPETIDFLSPILTVIPLQLFSYYMALEHGKNPDKPRNLAKTVTVS